MKTKSIVVLVCMFCLLLTGCTLPSSPPATLTPTPAPREIPGVTVEIKYLTDGTVLGMGPHPVLITANGEAISSFPRQLRLLVNGLPDGDPFSTVYAETVLSNEFTWTPPAPGEYLLQGEVQMRDGDTGITPVIRICIVGLDASLFSGGLDSYGYAGPCQIPTPLPPAQSSAPLGMTILTSPPQLTFLIPNPPHCTGIAPVKLTFVATVTDPADDIVLVRVIYTFHESSPYAPSEPYHILYLNWTSIEPGNIKTYRGTTVDLWQMLTDIRDSGGFTSGGSDITWFAQGIPRNGGELLRLNGSVPIVYGNCPISQGNPNPGINPPGSNAETITSPTAPPEIVMPTPLGPPTFTFKKNAFCRKGPASAFPDVTGISAGDTVDILNVSQDGFWYFIYWKKFNAKCWVAANTGDVNGELTGIKVVIVPTLPAPKPPAPPAPGPVVPVEPVATTKPCNPFIAVCP